MADEKGPSAPGPGVDPPAPGVDPPPPGFDPPGGADLPGGADPPGELNPAALIDAIDERAKAERGRLLEEAAQRAAAILADADVECARLKAEALAELEKELAAEQLRLLGEATMRARAKGLERRRELLAQAFRLAGDEISRRRQGPGGPAAQAALAQEARAAVGEPCSVETAEDGTIRAISGDGRRSVENGLDERLRRAQVILEHEAARLLFGNPGSEPNPRPPAAVEPVPPKPRQP